MGGPRGGWPLESAAYLGITQQLVPDPHRCCLDRNLSHKQAHLKRLLCNAMRNIRPRIGDTQSHVQRKYRLRSSPHKDRMSSTQNKRTLLRALIEHLLPATYTL